MATLPITNCPDGVGSVNNPENGSTAVSVYRAPELCMGDVDYTTQPDKIQEQWAAENLNMSGAPVNVFKLLGVHDLVREAEVARDRKVQAGAERGEVRRERALHVSGRAVADAEQTRACARCKALKLSSWFCIATVFAYLI